MAIKTIAKILPVAALFTIITVVVGYAHQKFDPFAEYRKFTKKPLTIEEKKLNHYDKEEYAIRQKLKLNLSERERSIIAGLHWVITVADDEKNFKFIFTDLILLNNSLSHAEDRVHQKEIVLSIIKTTLLRGEKQLSQIFGKDEQKRAQYLSLLSMTIPYPDLHAKYVAFYKGNWGPINPKDYENDDKIFKSAIIRNDYKLIFDFLLQTGFLHYFNKFSPNHNLDVPEDKFEQHLKEFESFNYITDHPIGSPQFRSLGYLATHVILILNNYGEFPPDDSVIWKKAQVYIESSLDKASKMGDFDLLAEYVQCLKFFKPGANDKRIAQLEKFIYALQRPNGSWGSERDFATNAYTAIHPSGAALMALNSGNMPIIKKEDVKP